MVKNRLNVEKKYKDADISTFAAGQANANADGYNWFDVTPDISQGTDSDERVGNSLKITGLTFPLQFTQQSSCLGARKLRVSLFRVLSADNDVNGQEVVEDYWDTNPLTGLRDYSAPRAYRSGKSDGIKCIRSMVVHVPATSTDNASTGLVDNTEINPKTLRMSVKLQDILRYSASGDTKPDGLRYFLVIQCATGNRNTGSATTSLDIPIQSANTGLNCRLAQRSWWVDN